MKPAHTRGFALVITLVLLALLVLAVYALGVLGRIGAETSGAGIHQLQARQHALAGLQVALGELQRHAGENDVVTAMAGVAGVPAGAGRPTRHWCGVWGIGGEFRQWLVSGVSSGALPTMVETETVVLLGEGALGADGTDKEHVRVPLQPVSTPAETGGLRRQGSYAYWIGDEGVKLSARIPAGETPRAGRGHALTELIPTLLPDAPALDRAESYAQLALVPPAELTPGQLQSNLHALTLAHRTPLPGGAWRTGLLNVNTTTVRCWRGLAATYNEQRPAGTPALTAAGFAAAMRDLVPRADSASGKEEGQPFVSVDSFFGSEALAGILDAVAVEPADFAAAMRPWLTVRSDTFRIRAYGEARNPADEATVEAVAYCEAIVQRTHAELPGFGQRFVVATFRWLGTDDI